MWHVYPTSFLLMLFASTMICLCRQSVSLEHRDYLPPPLLLGRQDLTIWTVGGCLALFSLRCWSICDLAATPRGYLDLRFRGPISGSGANLTLVVDGMIGRDTVCRRAYSSNGGRHSSDEAGVDDPEDDGSAVSRDDRCDWGIGGRGRLARVMLIVRNEKDSHL
jgi:hypothetical protein